VIGEIDIASHVHQPCISKLVDGLISAIKVPIEAASIMPPGKKAIESARNRK
jgi:hypothetical protein